MAYSSATSLDAPCSAGRTMLANQSRISACSATKSRGLRVISWNIESTYAWVLLESAGWGKNAWISGRVA